MLFHARFLLTMEGPPIAWGAIRIEADRIVEIGTRATMPPFSGEEVREFPDAVLMPGLINAHCHLELGMARSQLPRGETLPLWVSRLRKSLEGTDTEKFRQAARLGALECLKNGITCIVDVGNSGEAAWELASLPIRSFPYLETLGLDPGLAEAKVRHASGWLATFPPEDARFHPGVTCHAPYSCSLELMRSVTALQSSRHGPYTLHVAESAEEQAMFLEGKGALLDFCRRAYPALDWQRGESPIRFLANRSLIPRNSLLVHCNLADAAEARILSDLGTSVVHCPKSRAFFGHPALPLQALSEAGVNLCFGTDSLASNDSLSIFDEMVHFRGEHPGFPAREIMAMATLHPAKALGQDGEIGVLRPGAKADLIAIALRHHPECDLYEEIVGEAHEVVMVCVDGEAVVR